MMIVIKCWYDYQLLDFGMIKNSMCWSSMDFYVLPSQHSNCVGFVLFDLFSDTIFSIVVEPYLQRKIYTIKKLFYSLNMKKY